MGLDPPKDFHAWWGENDLCRFPFFLQTPTPPLLFLEVSCPLVQQTEEMRKFPTLIEIASIIGSLHWIQASD